MTITSLRATMREAPMENRTFVSELKMEQSNRTLGPYLTDDRGNSLYVFSEDLSGMSYCLSENCTSLFYPALRSNETNVRLPRGLNPRLLRSFSRPDGSMQIVYNSHPLYLYSKDMMMPRNILGHGYNSTWFLISPNGEPIVPSGMIYNRRRNTIEYGPIRTVLPLYDDTIHRRPRTSDVLPLRPPYNVSLRNPRSIRDEEEQPSIRIGNLSLSNITVNLNAQNETALTISQTGSASMLILPDLFVLTATFKWRNETLLGIQESGNRTIMEMMRRVDEVNLTHNSSQMTVLDRKLRLTKNDEFVLTHIYEGITRDEEQLSKFITLIKKFKNDAADYVKIKYKLSLGISQERINKMKAHLYTEAIENAISNSRKLMKVYPLNVESDAVLTMFKVDNTDISRFNNFYSPEARSYFPIVTWGGRKSRGRKSDRKDRTVGSIATLKVSLKLRVRAPAYNE